MTVQHKTSVWTNWSGALTCAPSSYIEAGSEDEIRAAIQEAAAQGRGPVRAPGTGHSFTPIVITDGTMINIDAHAGLVDVDSAAARARLKAGTKISDLGAPLLEAGLALANQGDINRQSIAGAISTGTHGTGLTLGSVSAQAAGLRIATADGGTINCSADENPEVFTAGRVSLGTLGIITEFVLQCLPAYSLRETGGRMAVTDVFAQMETLVSDNRHFEFFWFPFADDVLVKFLNTTDEPARPPRDSGGGMEQFAMVAACEISRFAPFMRGPLQRFLTNNAGARYMGADEFSQKSKVRHAYQAFPSDRDVRFNEMEFSVPLEQGPECAQELAEYMRKRGGNFIFPIEYRTIKGDDIWLSPFQGRDSVSISIHQYAKQDYRRLFDGAEAIFRNYGGRPHWGKLHTLTARELAPLYPHWDDFQAVRKRLDPKGLFLTPYLARLFGEDTL
ncbi:MAG: D-arabinono-1,4-lactone oxidase [Candidatus Phaeomarinobacter sp.]